VTMKRLCAKSSGRLTQDSRGFRNRINKRALRKIRPGILRAGRGVLHLLLLEEKKNRQKSPQARKKHLKRKKKKAPKLEPCYMRPRAGRKNRLKKDVRGAAPCSGTARHGSGERTQRNRFPKKKGHAFAEKSLASRTPRRCRIGMGLWPFRRNAVGTQMKNLPKAGRPPLPAAPEIAKADHDFHL